MIVQCEVLVVGAGPAGSMTAKTVAELGANVIFIEEHETPGTPVFCGEGLSIGGIQHGGLEPVAPYVCQKIKAVRIITPNGRKVELLARAWTGYILDRSEFDKALAENAVKAGAKLMVNVKATSVIMERNQVVGVKAIKDGEEVEFYAKVVVGADGHWSIIRRSAGLAKYFDDWVSCAQYQLSGLNLEDPSINEFWIGAKYAPGGYAWVFPKSNSIANVGLGVRDRHTKPAIEYLKDFVANDPRFRNAKIEIKNGGICPVSGTLDRIVMDGLMLTGDAAGQLIPMTGAGIHCAIESGKMAGRVAVEAIREGDVSEERLSAYRTEFDEYWGRRIIDAGKVLHMLDRFSDDDLNVLADVISHDEIVHMTTGLNVASVMSSLIKKSPMKLMQLIKAYLH